MRYGDRGQYRKPPVLHLSAAEIRWILAERERKGLDDGGWPKELARAEAWEEFVASHPKGAA